MSKQVATTEQVTLSLHFLGELTVRREGREQALPPSRKTRALLAYLALNPRPFRREHLCELLWEIPDDPRGSLRWSLSKLRRLVDDDEHRRILADRSHVSLDCSEISVDVTRLQMLARSDLSEFPVADLLALSESLCAPFLDGLELSNFHEFHSWCIALREDTRQAQVKLLGALIERLPDKQAVSYHQQLCALAPYDIDARGSLIKRLRVLQRGEEAEHHYRQGTKLLKAAGVDDRGRLLQSLRAPLAVSAANPATTAEILQSRPSPTLVAEESSPRLPQQFAEELVGRQREIHLVSDTLHRCFRQRSAAVLLLRGDPGIGKSHLLNNGAAMAREAGAAVFSAAAFESERMRPFAIWFDALRRLLSSELGTDELYDQQRISRNAVFERLHLALQSQTRTRPVVLLLDDIQWCDESSASALHFVLRMNRGQPILVIAAAREMDLPGNDAVQQALRGLRRDRLLHEHKLEALADTELAELITRFAPKVDAARLSRESHGNPLLALELARAEQQGANPGPLNELVEERLSSMESDAVEVIRWAAVLSPRISLHNLERTSQLALDVIGRSMDQAENQGMLRPAERGYRFSHELIARSIYDNISEGRRRTMHCRAAQLLEVESAADLQLASDLAHHAARSGDPLLATAGIVAAARLCLRFYANDDALKLYQQGLQFCAHLSAMEHVGGQLDLAEIRASAAPLEDWQAAADELIELAESALDHGALHYARQGYQLASYLRWVHGHCGEALSDSLQGERVTRSGTDREQVVGMAEAAKCLALLERDLSQADAMIMEAQALAKRHAYHCAAIPTCLGILRYYEGKWDHATAYLQEARALCKSQGDRVSEFLANEYLAIAEAERGNFQQAARHSKAMRSIAERLREGSEAPLAEAMSRLCRYALDGDSRGLDEACDRLRAVDAKQRLTCVLNRVARQDIERARWADAERRSDEALALAQAMELPTETLLACLNLAAIRQQQAGLAALGDDPLLEQIRTLSRATVGDWARSRAQRLLKLTAEELDT